MEGSGWISVGTSAISSAVDAFDKLFHGCWPSTEPPNAVEILSLLEANRALRALEEDGPSMLALDVADGRNYKLNKWFGPVATSRTGAISEHATFLESLFQNAEHKEIGWVRHVPRQQPAASQKRRVRHEPEKRILVTVADQPFIQRPPMGGRGASAGTGSRPKDPPDLTLINVDGNSKLESWQCKNCMLVFAADHTKRSVAFSTHRDRLCMHEGSGSRDSRKAIDAQITSNPVDEIDTGVPVKNRPSGRAPNGQNGRSMIWNGHGWNENTQPDIQQPNTQPDIQQPNTQPDIQHSGRVTRSHLLTASSMLHVQHDESAATVAVT